MAHELFDSDKEFGLLTTDQFIEFIGSFKKPILCPVCGSQAWSASGPVPLDVEEGKPKHHVIETLGMANYEPSKDSALNYPGGMPLFRMTCENCSYLLLFSYKKARSIIKMREDEKNGKHQ